MWPAPALIEVASWQQATTWAEVKIQDETLKKIRPFITKRAWLANGSPINARQDKPKQTNLLYSSKRNPKMGWRIDFFFFPPSDLISPKRALKGLPAFLFTSSNEALLVFSLSSSNGLKQENCFCVPRSFLCSRFQFSSPHNETRGLICHGSPFNLEEKILILAGTWEIDHHGRQGIPREGPTQKNFFRDIKVHGLKTSEGVKWDSHL